LNIPGPLQHALNLLGVIYLDQCDYSFASDFLGQSISLARGRSTKTAMREILVNIGAANLRAQRYDEALANYQEALKGFENVEGGGNLRGLIHQGIGVVLESKGDYPAALHQFDEGMALAEESGDRARLAELSWRKGQVKYRQD